MNIQHSYQQVNTLKGYKMSSAAYTPEYSTISITETQKLASVKASGACWAIYAVLVSYSRNGVFEVFPSWDTISRVLNHSYSRKTIADALNFLEKHTIIKRKSSRQRRSKTIKLITRKIQASLQPLFKEKVKKTTPRRNPGGFKRKSKNRDPEISKKLALGCRNPHQKKIREENISISMNRTSETLPEECIRWYESAVAYILEPTIWPIPDKLKDKKLLNKLLISKWFPPGSIPAIKMLATGREMNRDT